MPFTARRKLPVATVMDTRSSAGAHCISAWWLDRVRVSGRGAAQTARRTS